LLATGKADKLPQRLLVNATQDNVKGMSYIHFDLYNDNYNDNFLLLEPNGPGNKSKPQDKWTKSKIKAHLLFESLALGDTKTHPY
jgi:hypothetical protein